MGKAIWTLTMNTFPTLSKKQTKGITLAAVGIPKHYNNIKVNIEAPLITVPICPQVGVCQYVYTMK